MIDSATNIANKTLPFMFPQDEVVDFASFKEFVQAYKPVGVFNVLVWWEWVVDNDFGTEPRHILQMGFYQISKPIVVRVRVVVSPGIQEEVKEYLHQSWQILKGLWEPISSSHVDLVVQASLKEMKTAFDKANAKPTIDKRIERFNLR